MQADLSIVNDDGDTPLHLAAKYNRIKVLRYMGKTFPKLDTKNKSGQNVQSILKDKKLNYMKYIHSGRVQNRDFFFAPGDDSSNDSDEDAEDRDAKKKDKKSSSSSSEGELPESKKANIEKAALAHMDEWIKTTKDATDAEYYKEKDRYTSLLTCQEMVDKRATKKKAKEDKNKAKEKEKKEKKNPTKKPKRSANNQRPR